MPEAVVRAALDPELVKTRKPAAGHVRRRAGNPGRRRPPGRPGGEDRREAVARRPPAGAAPVTAPTLDIARVARRLRAGGLPGRKAAALARLLDDARHEWFEP